MMAAQTIVEAVWNVHYGLQMTKVPQSPQAHALLGDLQLGVESWIPTEVNS